LTKKNHVLLTAGLAKNWLTQHNINFCLANHL
jgi:hypothetical protein